jgi:hypothetical protein
MFSDVFVTEDTLGGAVHNVIHELTILVVADLRLVHVEGLDGDGLALGNLGVWSVLVAGTHGVAAQGDVIHPVRVNLIPRGSPL